MAKHSGRHVSKKGLKGLTRINRKSDNKRVWFYQGKQYDIPLRELVTMFNKPKEEK